MECFYSSIKVKLHNKFKCVYKNNNNSIFLRHLLQSYDLGYIGRRKSIGSSSRSISQVVSAVI